MIDIMFWAVLENITFSESFLDFIFPKGGIHEETFFLIFWGEKGIFNIILPVFFKFVFIVGVIS